MGIKIDKSTESGMLITCSDCPYWFSFQWTLETAEASAGLHEARVHPGSRNVRDRQANREKKRRARSNVPVVPPSI